MLRAQDAMQDLSGRGSRHILFTDERHRSRPLVAGNAILAPVEDFIRCRGYAIAGNNHGVHPFAPCLIRNPDDSDVFHLWMSADK